jgi:putative flippase GtrA
MPGKGVRPPISLHVEKMTLSLGRDPSVRHHRRIARYLLVGIVSFLLDVASLWLAYRMFHLPIAQATTLGFLVGLGFNFSASKLFTFRERSDTHGQAVRYAALLGLNYLLTLAIVSASEAWGPGFVVGKLCSVGLITSLDYLALGHWVFVAPRPDRVSDRLGFRKTICKISEKIGLLKTGTSKETTTNCNLDPRPGRRSM